MGRSDNAYAGWVNGQHPLTHLHYSVVLVLCGMALVFGLATGWVVWHSPTASTQAATAAETPDLVAQRGAVRD